MVKRTRTDHLVIHCSATDPKWHGRITIDDIDRWHRERGFDEVGYHFFIDRSGVLETGRDLLDIGAHVRSHNHNTIGICLEGGVEVEQNLHTGAVTFRAKANYTQAQWITLESLIQLLLEMYPHCDVRGHRDFEGVAKQCPSFDAHHWWEEGEVEP